MSKTISDITANLTIEDFTVQGGKPILNNKAGVPGMLLVWMLQCGHCHRFIPTMQSVSKKLNSRSITFPCVAIESEELKKDGGKLSNALGVQGYPTILFFGSDGKVLANYEQGRDENTLLGNICSVYHQCVEKNL